eukprot:TRINITY_DN1400_c1_g1_i1.p1 TRINITY_DN1400_c1_g1~~TRINITY_DN1400_c1_g1_i1.p1  ORF type:complete len:812 (+),score=355.71 TRINITY_DN1400_c1_g1_i1:57-2492(+)
MPPKKGSKPAAKKGPGAGAIAALKAKREKELAEQKKREEEEEAERVRIEAEVKAADEAERLRQEKLKEKKENKVNPADAAKAKKLAENRRKLEMMQKSGMQIPEAMLKKLQGLEDDEPKKPKEKKQTETLAQKKKRLEKEKAEREAAELEKKQAEKPAEKKDDGADDWEAEADDWENQADKEPEVEAEEVKEEVKDEPEEEEEEEEEEEHVDPVLGDDLRSPICCVLGHVDTGKTKLLDYIRRTNVQNGEAGGITQQIGASFFPVESILEKTRELNNALKTQLEIKVPGLLVIDTPGHESFANLRGRGSALCDIAILVVDIMHGLEPQTKESIQLLKKRKCPFVVALNKIDRLYDWETHPHAPFPITFKKQKDYVQGEFDKRLTAVQTELAEQGLNSVLYTKNKNFLKNVSLVPTSAHTGEGVPDLLLLMVQLTQRHMNEKLQFSMDLQCTLLEVKKIEGHGVTIDVILVNGMLKEGDTILVCGLNGPIVTQVRALLTPHPMKEIRVKGDYVHHKKIKAAQGIKIAATGLEEAVPGTPVLVVNDGDDIEELQEQVMSELGTIVSRTQGDMGVTVQSSTLGALEALLEFLKDCKIPVSTVGVGELNKKDIMRAVGIKEKNPKYAVILCFDVEVSKEAQSVADKEGIKIFTADIIYHLQDKFKAYLEDYTKHLQEINATKAVFPCKLKIVKDIRGRDPIVLGVVVEEGQVRVGTPLFVWKEKDGKKTPLRIGKVLSMEKDHKSQTVVKKGPQEFAIKVNSEGITFGRQLTLEDSLWSEITRDSIDALKVSFKEEVSKEEWGMIIKLKKKLNIL